MPKTASELANQIVDDLKGAGYYADPAVLAPLLKVGDVSDSGAIEIAQAVVTESLREYARSFLASSSQATEVERIASLLRHRGIP